MGVNQKATININSSRRFIRFALFGLPGAGKSPAANFLLQDAASLNRWARRVRFADPLYEAQQVIYRLAGKPLLNASTQDGKLLNFLGTHFRCINPMALIDRYVQTEACVISQFEQSSELEGLLLNDDMRFTEADFLRSRNYLLVRIAAAPHVCRKRRALRGDMTLGTPVDSVEGDIEAVVPDAIISNEGSLSDLNASLIALMRGYLK